MLSFSLTLLTVLSNRRIASSMVTEKVTVMARITMVSIIPTEIFLFIGILPSAQQHQQGAAQQGQRQQRRQHDAGDPLEPFVLIRFHTFIPPLCVWMLRQGASDAPGKQDQMGT